MGEARKRVRVRVKKHRTKDEGEQAAAAPSKQEVLKTDFYNALAFSQDKSNKGPSMSNDTLLMFYSLFKQATSGPCNEKPPSRFNIVARAKWDAWKKLKTLSSEDAMERYLAEFEKMRPDWRVAFEEAKKVKLRSKL